MPCLYVMEFEAGQNAIVKYGISAGDTPWTRQHEHTSARDNPYRERIAPRVAASFRYSSLSAARAVETAIKSEAIDSLLRVPSHLPAHSLCVLISGGHRAESPSGEWLAYPLCERLKTRPAVNEFYRLARAALIKALKYRSSVDAIAATHLHLRRAQKLWSLGLGYTEHHVPDRPSPIVSRAKCLAPPFEPYDRDRPYGRDYASENELVEFYFPLGLPEGFM